MKDKLSVLKNKARQKTANAILFGYAVVAGTSIPLVFSRCSSNCLSCGGCLLILGGMLPLVLFVTIKGRIVQKLRRLTSLFHKGDGPDS